MANSDIERLVCVVLVDWININGELVEKGSQAAVAGHLFVSASDPSDMRSLAHKLEPRF